MLFHISVGTYKGLFQVHFKGCVKYLFTDPILQDYCHHVKQGMSSRAAV